jgi:hypothetical protein
MMTAGKMTATNVANQMEAKKSSHFKKQRRKTQEKAVKRIFLTMQRARRTSMSRISKSIQ